ncbi:hypothetical protein CHU93_06040 [Sandarakinorhabdus cyanobacteriorum]|uniref:SnoaL-like domain-containing protein n=1 Tax=Sandarakinorhabdus cyanobacteriorum TaxID=1981098 RepID=A0A255YNS0_9SPHN|nr:hypothetical protein [Sandarakinorhabdus cyanobacteriorum]OYQ30896.1 hypothetical protein CHU93_06040 [Sandarakinorhabdus cyanobacteriorum]
MQADVQAFFAAYSAAFARQDSAALVAAWSFPALISGPGTALACDEALFRRNVEALFGLYDRQGVANARATVTGVVPLAPGVVLSHTHYAMLAGDGDVITDWDTQYLLRDRGQGFRAFAAVSDGEVAAWAARGTPLGSRA